MQVVVFQSLRVKEREREKEREIGGMTLTLL